MGIAVAIGSLAALGLAELLLRNFDVVGRNYATEIRTYYSTTLRFPWEGRTPTEAELDGRLFWHRASLDLDLGSFRLKTNQLGLRGPEVIVPKPTGVFRVLLLGDSVAFGWGVDDHVTFARRLETEWNVDPGLRSIEVINTGHPLYDSRQEEATLREFLTQLTPDLVLLVYVINDIDPTRDTIEALMLGKHPDPAEALTLPDDTWSWLASHMEPVLPSLAEFVLTHTNIDARVMATVPPGQPRGMEFLGKGPRGWRRSQQALTEIRDQCANAALPLLLLDHTTPRLPSLEPFCAENGIAYAPFRFSSDDFGQGIANSRLDPHANAKGHALLTQRLREILLARGLLPAR